MRTLLCSFIILAVLGCRKQRNNEQDTPSGKVSDLHQRLLTMDTHVDINVENFTDSKNYTLDLDTQVNLPKLKAGGLDAAWFIVYTGQDSLTDSGFATAADNARNKFEAIHRLCDQYAPDQIGLALTSEDVVRLDREGKKIALIGVENAYPMGTDLREFERYYDLGARYISLAHNGHSQFCDSHTGEESGTWLHDGLSELGIQAVREMSRLGIMIDVSHLSRKSMMQICDLSGTPIIASHSSARALCDHSRNLDDEQLDRIKALGGVVQTVALDDYLKADKSEARRRYLQKLAPAAADSLGLAWYSPTQRDTLNAGERARFRANYAKIMERVEKMALDDPQAPPAVDVADLVDHIDYMVDRIGIDHVGISSDFDGGGGIAGWRDASETENVTRELVARGYTEKEIGKLWGGNLLRVMDAVQAAAEEQ